jgi:hypothetical protein
LDKILIGENMNDLTATELKVMNNVTNEQSPSVDLGTKLQEIIDNIVVPVVPDGTPVNAVNATGTLTLTGVVIHGEKVLIGEQIYEFLTTAAQEVGAPGSIAVDIESFAVKASRVLTMDTQPTSGDTVTIGTKVYTFVPVGTDTADGEISIGADLAAAKVNFVAAVNGTDEFNIPHTLVTAGEFVADACTITALIGGTVGNAIATTETFTAGTNVFAGVTLASGANCTAANADGVLISTINAEDTQGVAAAQGTGTTVDLTADVAGVAANEIITGTAMANGSFGHAHLTGGVNGTVGSAGEMMYDASYLYVASAANLISGKNWRRMTLGSAY